MEAKSNRRAWLALAAVLLLVAAAPVGYYRTADPCQMLKKQVIANLGYDELQMDGPEAIGVAMADGLMDRALEHRSKAECTRGLWRALTE